MRRRRPAPFVLSALALGAVACVTRSDGADSAPSEIVQAPPTLRFVALEAAGGPREVREIVYGDAVGVRVSGLAARSRVTLRAVARSRAPARASIAEATFLADASGVNALDRFLKRCASHSVTVVFCELRPEVRTTLAKLGVMARVEEAPTYEEAITLAAASFN